MVLAAAAAPEVPAACDLPAVDQALSRGDFPAAEACAASLEAALVEPLDPAALPILDRLVRARLGNGRASLASTWRRADRAMALADAAELADAKLDAQANLGRLLLATGQSQQAISRFDAVVEGRRRLGLRAPLVEALADAAEARIKAARGYEALNLLEDAELEHGRDDDLTAARLLALRALAHRELGDAAAARPLLEEALAIDERLAPDHPDTALAWAQMGELLSLEGRLDEALVTHRRALALASARLGPESPRLIKWLGRVAALETRVGDLAAAVEMHQRAVDVARRELGADDPETSNRLNDFAGARMAAGDWASAGELYSQALDLAERLAEPERTLTAATIHYNLGEVARNQGALDRAAVETELARAGWAERLGSGHPYVALALEALAEIEVGRGSIAEQRRILEQALAIRRAAQGDSHPATAATACQLAEAALAAGDLDRARFAETLAAGALSEVSAIQPLAAARILALRARVAFATGPSSPGMQARDQAFDRALASERIYRQHLRDVVRYLAERPALRLAAARPPALDLALSIVADGVPDDTMRGRVMAAVASSRGLVLETLADRARAINVTGEYPEQRARLERASRELTGLLYLGPGGAGATFARRVESARQARLQAERDLALASAGFRRELAVRDLETGDLAAAVPESTALVAFVRFLRFSASGGTGEPAYAAFVLRSGDLAPRFVSLGAAEPIEAAVAKWRARVSQVGEAQAHGATAEADYLTEATVLADLVWRPLELDPQRTPRVLVVADAALQAVAFAALPGPSGAYLVEAGYEIHYLATERELFRTPSRQRGEGLLVVGAPAFDATDAEIAAAASSIPGTEPAWPVQAATVGTRPDATSSVATAASAATRGRRSGCAAAARLSFGELPGSALEAADVATIWRASGGGPVSLLTGAAAGTEAFRSLVAGRRIVHVATHGFYLGTLCGAAGSEESPTSENPMLLAGLAFAGAGSRHAASGGDDDGILTAEEISRLPLEGAEWIVLSACDTGQGQVEQREGVLGLRQAFSTAGARTLISSLWPVDDAQTRSWMMALYRARLERGMDTAQAAATANLELLRALRERAGHGHPALWAAFVGSGDWR